jgi:catechol 2,3-dioxygenase-like lactoylglutathione lyase family enzyme
MKLKLHHVAIRVKDFERCKQFYEKYFGFEQFDSCENQPPIGKELHLRSGDVHLELFYARESAKDPELDEIGKVDSGVCHFCFYVAGIEDIYDRMKSDGVPIHAELTRGTLDSGKESQFFFFKDPDGTVVEVLEE